MTSTATVVRLYAPGAVREADHHQAKCPACGWSGKAYPHRAGEGRRRAERDAADHRCLSTILAER